MNAEAFAGARETWEHGAPPSPLRERRTVDEPTRLALCPRCGRLMDRRDVGGAYGAIIDVCRGHGAWLDPGELEKLRAFARTPEAAALVAELAASPRARAIPFGDSRWWVEPAGERDETLGALIAGALGALLPW